MVDKKTNIDWGTLYNSLDEFDFNERNFYKIVEYLRRAIEQIEDKKNGEN